VLGVDGEVLGHFDLRSLRDVLATYSHCAKPSLMDIKNRHLATALPIAILELSF
jgi:hypothetical protein